jgi:hypothetical protein
VTRGSRRQIRGVGQRSAARPLAHHEVSLGILAPELERDSGHLPANDRLGRHRDRDATPGREDDVASGRQSGEPVLAKIVGGRYELRGAVDRRRFRVQSARRNERAQHRSADAIDGTTSDGGAARQSHLHATHGLAASHRRASKDIARLRCRDRDGLRFVGGVRLTWPPRRGARRWLDRRGAGRGGPPDLDDKPPVVIGEDWLEVTRANSDGHPGAAQGHVVFGSDDASAHDHG